MQPTMWLQPFPDYLDGSGWMCQMGINVSLIDENGTEIDAELDDRNVLKNIITTVDDASFVCLPFIDPYGDTIFNRLQAEVIVKELQAISKGYSSIKERGKIAAIINLAERCRAEPHLFLKFIGD